MDHHRFAKPPPLSTHDNGLCFRANDGSGPRSVKRGRCPLWVKSGHCAVQNVMSALPPKADMCGATRYVRFVPIADMGHHGFNRTVARNGGSPLTTRQPLSYIRAIASRASATSIPAPSWTRACRGWRHQGQTPATGSVRSRPSRSCRRWNPPRKTRLWTQRRCATSCAQAPP